ncbi:MAG TPA: LysE family transporter [Chthoniobacterales bacterium]|nr:LysE family transporter [Chthoniobacterales bacterium]
MQTATLINGFVLGWSVAWPPGPVNAEMLRRSVMPASQGGGFWAAWRLGLGACTGDFIWALAVMTGAGALLNTPRIRQILAVVSFLLLLFLAGMFALGAWRAAHSLRGETSAEGDPSNNGKRMAGRRGYLLGLTLALTSPWNLGFWLAVIGGQQSVTRDPSFGNSLVFAVAVVLGAVVWTLVFSVAVKHGGKIFARPVWQAATQAITSLLMFFFAGKLLVTMS